MAQQVSTVEIPSKKSELFWIIGGIMLTFIRVLSIFLMASYPLLVWADTEQPTCNNFYDNHIALFIRVSAVTSTFAIVVFLHMLNHPETKYPLCKKLAYKLHRPLYGIMITCQITILVLYLTSCMDRTVFPICMAIILGVFATIDFVLYTIIKNAGDELVMETSV
ncbi:unnamed protein product [Orchesella dallaii]|uniref:Transmembrane protein n=1 Tax=Orchesella dallaii TaxID=48710 RepID=A0ABP1R1G1_9HEXA